MHADPRLVDLVIRYEELQQHGTPPTPEQLCADSPELLEPFKKHLAGLTALRARGIGGSIGSATSSEVDGATTVPPGSNANALAPVTLTSTLSGLCFHAKGGMGEVYEAHDDALGRRVALKLIKSDQMHAARRFLVEAEITSRLDHPGIAPVHGVSQLPDGRPCYTMRFIEGEDLQDAIKRFHGASPASFDSLEFRQLLQRFVAICNTIAYAHDQGVIHRDIKPKNVRLGRFGETLVLDWGLAKHVERTEEARERSHEELVRPTLPDDNRTQLGAAVGTWPYMSPEQAAGNWDTVGPASDVYSLGATLYEVLTAISPPVAGRNRAETQHKIQRGEFARPREVDKLVPRALEAVCLKAMALKPGERYQTAAELAGDVERWLGDEAVGALREPWNVKARRWGRRHRTLVTTSVGALVVATTLLVPGVLLLGLKNQALTLANSKERAARDFAQKTIDDVTSPEALKFLETQKELQPRQVAFLKKVVEYYAKFAVQEAVGEQERVRQANAYLQIGTMRKRLGDRGDARAAFEMGVALYGRLAADFPDNEEYRANLAGALNNLGGAQADTGRSHEAIDAYERALRIYQRLQDEGPSFSGRDALLIVGLRENLGGKLFAMRRLHEALTVHERTRGMLEQMLEQHPGLREFRVAAANNLNAIGNVQRDLKRSESALQAYQGAHRLLESLQTDADDADECRVHLAHGCNNLGLLHSEGRDLPTSRRFFEQSLALREALVDTAPRVTTYREDLATTYQSFGQLLEAQGHLADAERKYAQALALRENLLQANPGVPRFHVQLSQTLERLMRAQESKGETAAATATCNRLVELTAQLAALAPVDDDAKMARATELHRLGILCSELGRQSEAIAAFAQARPILEASKNHRETGRLYYNLALAYAEQGQTPDAHKWCAHAWKIQSALLAAARANPLYQHDLSMTCNKRGELHWQGEELIEAQRWFEEADRIRQSLLKHQGEDTALLIDSGGTACNLGIVHFSAGRYLEALRSLDRAAELLARAQARAPRHPKARSFLYNTHHVRGRILVQLERQTEAVQAWDKAIEFGDGRDKAWFEEARIRSLILSGLNEKPDWHLLWGLRPF